MNIANTRSWQQTRRVGTSLIILALIISGCRAWKTLSSEDQVYFKGVANLKGSYAEVTTQLKQLKAPESLEQTHVSLTKACEDMVTASALKNMAAASLLFAARSGNYFANQSAKSNFEKTSQLYEQALSRLFEAQDSARKEWDAYLADYGYTLNDFRSAPNP